MTQVGESASIQPPLKPAASEARRQIEENRALPDEPLASRSTSPASDAKSHLNAKVNAAALGDVSQALEVPLDLKSKIAAIAPAEWPKSEKDLLSKLTALLALTEHPRLNEEEFELLRDAFDQISTMAGRSANLITGAQTGYWEVEIPNLSFLKKRQTEGHPPIIKDSMLEKITDLAENLRTKLHIAGGESYGEVKGTSPREKIQQRPTRSPSFEIHDLVETLRHLKKSSPTFSQDYKALLDELWNHYQAGHKSTVKTSIALLDLDELMKQSILHKDIKILCLYGFEEPDKKASLINYCITEKPVSDLQALLEAGLKPQVNQRDEEKILPLEKAIMEGKLTHAELLLQSGADPKLFNREEKARVLEKIELLLQAPSLEAHQKLFLQHLQAAT